jgi:hypothetical protein
MVLLKSVQMNVGSAADFPLYFDTVLDGPSQGGWDGQGM